MNDEILNIPLYNALDKIFDGDVRITNHGIEGDLETTKDKNGIRATKSYGGEQYYTNCPVCGDTRHRLYISHWAFKDIKKGKHPVYTNGLFYCQNEQCNVADLKKQISEIIDKKDMVSTAISARGGKKKKKQLNLPEGCLPVNDPMVSVAVHDYLRGRGFDLDILANGWHVHAVETLEEYPQHGPKIIYPVFSNGELVFWQARLAWDPTKEQQRQGVRKYYFPPGSSKSEFLYNKDEARKKDIVVIVEGITDAHRVGDNAVAIFGKVPSVRQTNILQHAFQHSVGVLLLDSDAREKAEKFYKKYKNDIFHKPMGLITLDEGDPAGYSRGALWDMIEKEVRRIV